MIYSVEELEALQELVDSEGWRVFLNATIPQLRAIAETKLVKLSIEQPSDVHTLLINRARLDGVNRLCEDIRLLAKVVHERSHN